MPLALITGGSAGIGAAFADRLAARGHDLILVARGELRLNATARIIAARHSVRVDTFVTDLADRHGLFRLEALLSGPEGLAVDATYVGRTVAGLMAATSNGSIRPGETTVLMHTGGLPGLFGHPEVG